MENILTRVLILSVIVLFSCTKSEKVDCKLISEMMKTDQLYRADARVHPFLAIEDSLRGHRENLDKSFSKEAEEIYLADKDTSWHKGFINKRIADSLMTIQSKIDEENVNKIFGFMKEYKNNRIDTLSCLDDVKIILAHAPTEKCDEILKLLDGTKIISGYGLEYLKKIYKSRR